MAIIKVVNPLSISRILLNKMSTVVEKKLSEYCTKRIIELGLATRSFPFEFVFYRDVVNNRKSVAKLKTLLLKYILKNIPYVTFALHEFLQVHNRESLVVNLYTTESRDTLSTDINWEDLGHRSVSLYSALTNSSFKTIYAQSGQELNWIKRYCKYLNYLCRKHHVPLKASLMTEIIADADRLASVKSLSISDRTNSKIPHSINVGMQFQFVKWVPLPAYTDQYLRVRETGEDDSLFSSENSWSTNQLYNSGYGLDSSNFHKCSPEKLFLHMDKGMKILTTLTRKVRYGSSAFSFRDN